MLFFYLLACVPVAIGAFLWMTKREIVWWEWLVGSMAGFAVAGLMHLIAIHGMTADSETWSGRLVNAIHHPRWVEEYTVQVAHTAGKTTYYTTEYRYTTHHKHWTCEDTLGNTYEISEEKFHEIAVTFGNVVETRRVYKSGFYSGDHNVYVAENKTGYIHPTNTWKSFENRVKAAPSLFSFTAVPKDVKVFPYPANQHWNVSDRLVGTAVQTISILEWDRMNARLGPTKKVNVIAVGFGPDAGSEMGQWQQASWVGGKKNDVVICYGGGTPTKPGWVFVFGWTESELAKRNLETIVLGGPMDNSILPAIEKEIVANYQIKEWKKFDYITVDAPTWSYWVLIMTMVLTQGGYWYWAMSNGEDKDRSGGFRSGPVWPFWG